jgi:hypothetical protein
MLRGTQTYMRLSRVTIEDLRNSEIIGTSYNPGDYHDIPISWEEFLNLEKKRLELSTGCEYLIKASPRNRNRIALYSTNTLLHRSCNNSIVLKVG